MANPEWNSIDDKKIQAHEYYCAFIDILGYKHKSELYFEGKFNLEGRFNRTLDSSFKAINLSSLLVNAKDISIQFFSDSIILLLPQTNDRENQLFSLTNFCAILSARLSMEDLFVRGGISLGSHMESQNKNGSTFMASIALQKAYILESQHAIYPRIIVEPALVEAMGGSADLVIAKDNNDHFVHFSPHIINNKGDNQDDVFKEMLDIEEARLSAPDKRAADKYKWILDYYYWTLSLCSGVDMKKFSNYATVENRGFSLINPKKPA